MLRYISIFDDDQGSRRDHQSIRPHRWLATVSIWNADDAWFEGFVETAAARSRLSNAEMFDAFAAAADDAADDDD